VNFPSEKISLLAFTETGKVVSPGDFISNTYLLSNYVNRRFFGFELYRGHDELNTVVCHNRFPNKKEINLKILAKTDGNLSFPDTVFI